MKILKLHIKIPLSFSPVRRLYAKKKSKTLQRVNKFKKYQTSWINSSYIMKAGNVKFTVAIFI